MLIEREDELESLRHLFELAKGGKGQVALIMGEAGIGKSSLISEFRSTISKSGEAFRWISGGCEAMFTPRTLGLIHDIAPSLGSTVETELQTGENRSQLFNAVLSSLPADEPTILVCEDLHWADHATLDLLKFIARRMSILPVLLLVTFRDDEVGVTHPLAQVLGDLPAHFTRRLQLRPLSQEAVAHMARAHELDNERLYEVTNGNPFYVSELLGSDAKETYVPASIRDAVTQRLGKLTTDERKFLEGMSVVPGSVTYSFLEKLFGDEAFELATQCVIKQLLVEEGAHVKFRHELARLATLDRLPPARRRAYHANCLNVLTSGEGVPALDKVVHHASGAYNGGIVLQYAPEAAKAAARAGSHREAAAHYATALRFVDDAPPELAAELYESWAYEAALSDRIDEEVLEARRHALTLWRALGQQDKVGQNLRHLSRLHWYRGESTEATRFSDQAIRVLESIEASSERTMAYSLRSQLHMLNDKMDEAIEWGERALSAEDQFTNADIRAHALNNVGTAKVFRGDTSGLPYLQESLDLSLTNGLHEHAARAYNNLAEYAVEFYQFDLAETTLSDGLAFDTERDLDAWTHYLSGRLAQLRLEQGRIDDAIRIAEGVAAIERLSLLMKLPAQLVYARAKMRRGDKDVQSIMLDALANSVATDELQYIVPARLTIIEWAWLHELNDQATEHLNTLLELSADDRHPWNIGSVAIWAKRFGMAFQDVAGLPEPFTLELAGDHQGAAKAWQSLGANYAGALALLAGGDAADLSEASSIAQEIGAQSAIAKANSLASSLGETIKTPSAKRGPYKASRTHPLGLTAKEQVVLGYLSKGLSNREIADELSRSQRTIEHHVSSILDKLKATNRMAAVLRVQNEPWLVSD